MIRRPLIVAKSRSKAFIVEVCTGDIPDNYRPQTEVVHPELPDRKDGNGTDEHFVKWLKLYGDAEPGSFEESIALYFSIQDCKL